MNSYLGWAMSYFEKIIEILFAIRIALSPALIGLATGAYLYFSAASLNGELLGIGIVIAGIIAGIVLVIRVKKKQTAVGFLTKVMATPELDRKKEE